ncbi:MAG: metallophosphoesterase [Culicoidibacterales bacterium]
MKFKKYGKRIVVGALLICLGVCGYIYWQNNMLVTSSYSYTNEQIPQAFYGFTIVQLSDLHNHDFGKRENRLVAKVKKLQPDAIVFTGDIIDSYKTDAKTTLELIDQLGEFSPLYYVVGNHEARIPEYAEFELALIERGVEVLRNEMSVVTLGTETIAFLGLDDPVFFTSDEFMRTTLADLQQQAGEAFPILLTHRPEYLAMYEYQQVPLVLVGHAHGGQVRLPFTEGVFAPGQGLWPQLTSGVHTQAETTMVISRGLGNSAFPIRVQNQPEIVTVTLSSE